jgi:DNA-binding response OmpR family regulator
LGSSILVVHRALDVDHVEQHVAADGDAALALVDEQPFDAVVLDLSLPPLDGWCVLARLGARTPRLRVIAAASDAADVERARRLGAEVYLLPFSAIGAVVCR